MLLLRLENSPLSRASLRIADYEHFSRFFELEGSVAKLECFELRVSSSQTRAKLNEFRLATNTRRSNDLIKRGGCIQLDSSERAKLAALTWKTEELKLSYSIEWISEF